MDETPGNLNPKLNTDDSITTPPPETVSLCVLEDFPSLQCPRCAHAEVFSQLLAGSDDTYFSRLRCHVCGEHAFLQVDLVRRPPDEDNEFPVWEVNTTLLQQEWHEWVQWRDQWLDKPRQKAVSQRKSLRWVVLFALLLAGFFLLDRYHLLGAFYEDIVYRQTRIDQYSAHIKTLGCLSASMLHKLETVPIHYTAEPVYHHSVIQYGETGSYWGSYAIKIFRSNFWFYGEPKKSLLIETLIHELRHRVNPEMGHSRRFFQLVNRDTQCVLKRWKE